MLKEKSDKPDLKVWFTDFWNGFTPERNFLTKLLDPVFTIIPDSVKPDILFYSYTGKDFLKYNCPRFYYTAENIRPRLTDCDYALVFDYSDNDRILRFPYYTIRPGITKLLHPLDIEEVVRQKSHFCSFVVSNRFSRKRIKFYKKLSKYKRVDSGGALMNNIGYMVGDKYAFMRLYKFNISFENSSYPGYTTEKLCDPMTVGTIPVYWGNPLVGRDFNTKSFINWHDYGSDDAVIERIIEIDKDESLYRQMLAEPWLTGGKTNRDNDLELIKDWLVNMIIAAKTTKPVGSFPGKRRRSFFYHHYIRPVHEYLITGRRVLFGVY